MEFVFFNILSCRTRRRDSRGSDDSRGSGVEMTQVLLVFFVGEKERQRSSFGDEQKNKK
jgi:hypothetical protein